MNGMKRIAGAALAVLMTGVLSGCGGPSGESTDPTRGSVTIKGAGATFPQPLYERWIELYKQQNPNVSMVYEGVGSGEGVKRFLAGTVDFGASDAAMSDRDLEKVDPEQGAVMIPMTAGMVVLAYNIPGVGKGLALPRDVYLDILSGKIRSWDDPRIAAANPGLSLPDLDIIPVVRRDSSGTTFALTNHLGAADPWWADQGPGVGKLVDWPGVAMTAIGNEGVAQRVNITDGAIGYMEYEFAERLGLPIARLGNQAGEIVAPSPKAGQAALANATEVPEDLRVFVADPAGAASYPIVTYTWVLLRERYADRAKAELLREAIGWGLTEGQPIAEEMGYIPLPDSMVEKAQHVLARVQ